MRRCKRGVKGGQGRGQGSNLRGHLPGSCEVRVLFGTGRENPANKIKSTRPWSPAGPCRRHLPSKDQGVPLRSMYVMGAAFVDLSYHGYRSSGSDAPAPTQATLHMRAGASQGPTLECGLSGGLSARRGGRTRGDVRVRARWGRTRSKTGHPAYQSRPTVGAKAIEREAEAIARSKAPGK